MKVKARIAAAIDVTGKWHASGWRSDASDYDEQAMSTAVECVDPGERRYWIEVELELPEGAEPIAVTAVAEPAPASGATNQET